MFPTTPPATIAGKTLIGSAAAKGIAPSLIPINPIIAAAFPASFSSFVYFLGDKKVAKAIPRGGVQIAIPTPPINQG